MNQRYDAIVVGSGPNGLAAAITLARAKLSVLVVEANAEPGGGARSAELTLPGYRHDVCSAIHPLAAASPLFRSLPLEKHGLEWIQPGLPVAHPLDHGGEAWLERSLGRTIAGLRNDGRRYDRLMRPLVDGWQALIWEILQPLLHVPRSPILLSRFGMIALRPAAAVSRRLFDEAPGQALFGGLAAHSFLPLGQTASTAAGLVLGILAHAVGWPMPRGGAAKLTEALLSHFRELGGNLETGRRVRDLGELPSARAIFLDISPRQFLSIAGGRLPARYRRALERFRPGPGVFKMDFALAAPIPWSAEACRRAGTVHVIGALEELVRAEDEVGRGKHPERPFVLVTQPSLFDPTRAPQGRHVAWAYCHVPHGSTFDMAPRIEAQIERFAPGFRDCILAKHTRDTAALEAENANLTGGDINGGLANLRQLIARPVWSAAPYRTPLKGVFLCSASTPPGGGVHGMCGHLAAREALATWR